MCPPIAPGFVSHQINQQHDGREVGDTPTAPALAGVQAELNLGRLEPTAIFRSGMDRQPAPCATRDMVNTLCRAHSEQGLLSYDVVRLGGGGGGGGGGRGGGPAGAVVPPGERREGWAVAYRRLKAEPAEGLKIPRPSLGMRVRPPPPAPRASLELGSDSGEEVTSGISGWRGPRLFPSTHELPLRFQVLLEISDLFREPA